ncbi:MULTISPECIES: efflux RND transporter periplasmic adaptor subunit [Ferrimonas]|uniref:efflux RND transporter periplasmic adaptor subunit n=1 Tax=Ferrimonas TaxID=44011 RepID=UPI0003FA4C42|nr:MULTISPECIES: efflux RND transporter periplasmic adaptor subunit [Ferrimonas]USD38783.1 efflux RND transporter periplasmic adaptor subunit [Ferrimonas sp. SCSIO 43195]
MNCRLSVTALSLILTLTACGQAPANDTGADTTETAQTSETDQNIVTLPVETRDVVTGTVASYYSSTAILEAPEEAMVVSRVPGIITHIAVEEGDKVVAGQLLASIESERYRYNLNKAQAELDVIDQELNRLKKIANKQLVSEETMAKLEFRRLSAIADRDLAALQLKESRAVAPFDGVVAKRLVKRGNMAEQYKELFYVVRQDELHGILYLPEQELSQVRKGQLAQLILGANDQRFEAQVERISPIVDSDTGTFKVTLTVPNDKGQLKAGMFAKAKLKYDSHDNALVIPRTALLRQDQGHAVYVVEEGKAHRRQVELGFEDEGRIEILSGLSLQDKVVVRGQHQLKEDAHVEVIEPLQLAQR